MNAARDFIEKEILPWISTKRRQASTDESLAIVAMEDFILNNRHKWDKPSEQGVATDKESLTVEKTPQMDTASKDWIAFKIWNDTKNWATEKATDKESLTVDPVVKKSFTTETIEEDGVLFTPEEYKTYLQWQKAQALAWKNREELAPLPEKIMRMAGKELTELQITTNMIIDCIAALYEGRK